MYEKAEVYEKYTDFISDRQKIQYWQFNSSEIEQYYKVSFYSLAVEIEMFMALKAISESEYKTVREKKFTIFTGDTGPAFEHFCAGISGTASAKIIEIFTGCFSSIKGYEYTGSGRIPYLQLIPCYRYEACNVIEYTSKYQEAGRYRKPGCVLSAVPLIIRIMRV